MDLETILISIGVGTVITIIGGWVILYYATVKHENYHGYDDDRPELTKEKKKELNKWVTKNKDTDGEKNE